METLKQGIRKNGFILIRELFSREQIHSLALEVGRILEASIRETPEMVSEKKYFAQKVNLWEESSEVKKFIFSSGVAETARSLLEVSRIRLYHDQALYKFPNSKHTPWHVDDSYWPLDTDCTISAWIPLVLTTPEMGTMKFVPGSHLMKSSLHALHISEKSDTLYERWIQENKLKHWETPKLEVGDCTFHLGGTVHSAAANTTSLTRAVFTVIFYEDGARVSKVNSNTEADLKRFFPGLTSGDIAASRLNPLI